MATLTLQQKRVAGEVYDMGLAAGLPPERADELVAAAYAESGLNPNARNKSSGAAGLFQLLSGGYVSRATALGGVFDVHANVQAILPSYLDFWRKHPNAAPGEAAAVVEASGKPASFYAGPLSIAQSAVAGVKSGVRDLLRPHAGVDLNGVDPSLLSRLYQLALVIGKPIDITSGYRTPQHSVDVGGFANDPHTQGIAVDATIAGRPIGDVLPSSTLRKFGLLSGNQPGFDPNIPGGRDPVHVQLLPGERTKGFNPAAGNELASNNPFGWVGRIAVHAIPGVGQIQDIAGLTGNGPLKYLNPAYYAQQATGAAIGYVDTTFVKPAARALSYAGVYALLVMFSVVLAIIGVLSMLGVHPRTLASTMARGGEEAAAA